MLTESGLERQNKLRWAVQRTDDDRMDHVEPVDGVMLSLWSSACICVGLRSILSMNHLSEAPNQVVISQPDC